MARRNELERVTVDAETVASASRRGFLKTSAALAGSAALGVLTRAAESFRPRTLAPRLPGARCSA